MDHCPTCGADAAGTRFCNMCGARLLVDVLVDTAAGQHMGSRSEGFAPVPTVALPEQFEALFRPIGEKRAMDVTQPLAVLPMADGGLPIAPMPPGSDEGGGGRRRLLTILAVTVTLIIAVIVVVAVLVTGGSGTAAAGKPFAPATTDAAASTATTAPRAANTTAVTATTAASTVATTAAGRVTTTAKASSTTTTTRQSATTKNDWPGNLSVGSSGARVRQVQQALSKLHLYYGQVTGDYDASTATSVAIFQTGDKVPTNAYGTVDQATWNALMTAAG